MTIDRVAGLPPEAFAAIEREARERIKNLILYGDPSGCACGPDGHRNHFPLESMEPIRVPILYATPPTEGENK